MATIYVSRLRRRAAAIAIALRPSRFGRAARPITLSLKHHASLKTLQNPCQRLLFLRHRLCRMGRGASMKSCGVASSLWKETAQGSPRFAHKTLPISPQNLAGFLLCLIAPTSKVWMSCRTAKPVCPASTNDKWIPYAKGRQPKADGLVVAGEIPLRGSRSG